MKILKHLLSPKNVFVSSKKKDWLLAEHSYWAPGENERELAVHEISDQIEKRFEEVAGPDPDLNEWIMVVRRNGWLRTKLDTETNMTVMKAWFCFERRS